MSKYIIEADERSELVQVISVMPNGTVYTNERSIDELEELNSDYIDEHYQTMLRDEYDRGYKDGRNVTETQAHDDAYQRGFEDGKAVNGKGCEGCKYGGTPQGDSQCFNCSNYYKNNWTAKDDKIEVGDIIANNTEPKLKVWVTCFDEIGFCGIAITDFGTVDEEKLYSSCSPKGWHKIGHFDIASILEEMRHD